MNIFDLVLALSKKMPQGWKFDYIQAEKDPKRPSLIFEGGRRLYFYQCFKEKNKIRCSVGWPICPITKRRYEPIYWGIKTDFGQYLNIGFSRDKKIHVIARDIKKRVLDKYLPLYLKCEEEIEKLENKIKSQNEIFSMLQSLSDNFYIDRDHIRNPYYKKGGMRVDSLDIGFNKSINRDKFDIEINNISAEKLAKILVAIK